MNTYVQHIGLTAWRKRTALLLATALLTVIIFGLQYFQVDEKNFIKTDNDSPIVAAAEALMLQQEYNVKFVSTLNPKVTTQLIVSAQQPSHKEEETNRNRAIRARNEAKADSYENDKLLGIPYVNLDPNKPYIPKRRIVHLDLKGAPPLVSFFRKFFPMIKTMGATGILIEYEDMFPFSGPLKPIAAKNAYTIEQINEILKLAEKSNLEVIPLIQTFGHVEFALKHKEFINLREVEGSPQALCPSRNASLDFIKEMAQQVISLHPNIKYLHIGCDEVFQMGECSLCRLELHDNLFLKHIKNVADKIHEINPLLKLIIWDDMLRHLPRNSMMEINLGSLVEPMIWVYAEDIYRFVQPQIWDKYSTVFKTAWTASAFKGAFGETLIIPNGKRHLENNLRWLEVMSQQDKHFKYGLQGIVLTGWQRYDHFAVLCELLPAGIPSLALCLTTVTNGYFNSSLKYKFLNSLTCPQQSNHNVPFINLDTDPFLWDELGRCMFHGSPFFRLTFRLNNLEMAFDDYIRSTKKRKGWLTDYNVRHNYSLPLRIDELTTDLTSIYHSATSMIKSSIDAMVNVFDNYTINEWIEQKLYPIIVELEKIKNQSIALKSVNQWESRPLPPIKDLQRFGAPMP